METSRSSGLQGKKDDNIPPLNSFPNHKPLFPLAQVKILLHTTSSDSSVQIHPKPIVKEEQQQLQQTPHTLQNFI